MGAPEVRVETTQITESSTRATPASRAPLAPHAPTRARLFTAFAMVYVLWGSTFLAIRYAVETLPPFLMAGARHLVAGLVLYPLARVRSGERPTRANWLAAGIMGALLLLGGNGGVCWAEQYVPSGVAALLVATVSLWMVLIEWLRPGGVRPTPQVIAGLVLGFGGVALLVGPASLFGGAASGRVNTIGAIVLVVASCSWATGSVFSRRLHLPHAPLLGTAMQSLAGGVLLISTGLVTGQGSAVRWEAVSARSVLSLAYLIVFGSLLGFSAYTWLLRAAPPARVATYAYVNPVVAVFLGWAFAGERLALRTLVAAAVIIGAVVLVITARHQPAIAPDPDIAPAAERADAR